MALRVGAAVAALMACVAAAETPVTAGTNTLRDAIMSANEGDVLILAAGGVYVLESAVQIDKALTIRSEDATSQGIVEALTFVMFAINNVTEFQMEDVLLRDSAGAECGLKEPIALTAEFSYELFPPITTNTAGRMKMGITDGGLNVVGSIGELFNTRVLTDIMFDDCDYVGGKILAPFIDILPNCRADLGFSVKMKDFGACGVTITEYPTMNTYESDLKIWFDEFVTMVDEEAQLRVPVNRTGTAMTHLKIEIDTVANIAATISPQWIQAELEAAITSVDVMAISDNVSTIVLQVNVPSPYTVIGGSTGEVLFNQTDDGQMSTSPWRIGEACAKLDVDELCVQTITFDVTACDLSGLYYIFGVSFACIEQDSNGDPLDCPAILGDADLYFAIDGSDLCDDMFQLEALFTPTITLRPDDATYIGIRPNDTFSLGDMSYWTIHLWTNESGVGFDYAEIIKIVRTSDDVDCTGFEWFGEDISVTPENLAQTFVPYGPLQFPAADINFPMLVTVDMACARSDRERSALHFNFTVLGDYQDNSGRRRRRDINSAAGFPILDKDALEYSEMDQNGLDRRESGEAVVEGESGVVYSAKDFETGAQTDAASGDASSESEDGSNTMQLLGIIGGLLLLLCCCCCCCCVLGVVLYRRRGKAKAKRLAQYNAQDSSLSMASTTSATQQSGVNMVQPGYNIQTQSTMMGSQGTMLGSQSGTSLNSGGFNPGAMMGSESGTSLQQGPGLGLGGGTTQLMYGQPRQLMPQQQLGNNNMYLKNPGNTGQQRSSMRM